MSEFLISNPKVCRLPPFLLPLLTREKEGVAGNERGALFRTWDVGQGGRATKSQGLERTSPPKRGKERVALLDII
jgi:hypothetical protein